MSWVTIIWSMISSACLTLALVHLLVWWGRRDARGNMLFSILAVATAVYAGFELWMMHAKTPVAFGMGFALGPCTHLGDRSITRRIRTPLPAGRAVVVGLDGLRCSNALAHHQFRYDTEYQLSGDNLPATCLFFR